MRPAELAYRIGRSTTTLWRYERGDASPDLETARRIARVLGTSVDGLFADSADASDEPEQVVA
jgi:transcriptional regulator with XRE-family HTH domain